MREREAGSFAALDYALEALYAFLQGPMDTSRSRASAALLGFANRALESGLSVRHLVEAGHTLSARGAARTSGEALVSAVYLAEKEDRVDRLIAWALKEARDLARLGARLDAQEFRDGAASLAGELKADAPDIKFPHPALGWHQLNERGREDLLRRRWPDPERHEPLVKNVILIHGLGNPASHVGVLETYATMNLREADEQLTMRIAHGDRAGTTLVSTAVMLAHVGEAVAEPLGSRFEEWVAVRTLLRKGVRLSADMMASTNRNDPCPCGSGIKFKRCHLQRA